MLDVLRTTPGLARKRKYESNNMKGKSYQSLWNSQGRKCLFLQPFVGLLWQFVAPSHFGVEGFLPLTTCAIHSTATQNTLIPVQEQMIANWYLYLYVQVYIYIFTHIYTCMCLKIIQKYCSGLSASKFNKKCQLWSVRQWCYRRNACQKPFSGTTEKMSNYIMGRQPLTANSC